MAQIEHKSIAGVVWKVALSIAFMITLAQMAIKLYTPVRFLAWKDSPGNIKIEVYDVIVSIQDVKEDPVGVFVQFPDHSVQFVPVTEKPAWRK